ncbi:caspase family protein [Dongia deserti]|uniref:caspase family protein n=1 Tax=Dongia deserti TaxID=2268030 RepID=UPI0013C4EDCA|nr:caspase family protein [Dongia deserti]
MQHAFRPTFAIALLLVLAVAVSSIATARAQSVGDAISSALFENVIYAQAKLKVSTKLVRLKRMTVATGGDHLALLAEDGTIRVWNLLRGSQGRPIPAGRDVVFAPSADGTLLAIGDNAGRIELRDARTGAAVAVLTGDGAITQLATSADSLLLVAGTRDGEIEIWDIAGRKQVASGKVTNAPITAIAFGAKVLVGGRDGTVAIVQLGSGAAQSIDKLDAAVSDIRVAAEGKQAAVVTQKGHVAFVSLGGSTAEDVDLGNNGLFALGQSLRMAATMDGKSEIDVVDLANGKTIAELKVDEGVIIGLHVDDAAGSVMAATADGKLLVWEVSSRKQILSIFIAPTGWAMVDRQGRFDGTADGLKGLSWDVKKLNFPVSSMRQAFLDPGLLAAALKKSARAPREVPKDLQDAFPIPPTVEIEVVPGEKAAGKPYQLIVIAEDQGGGIKDVRLYHNGKIVSVGAVLEQKDAESKGRHIRVVGYNVWPVAGVNTFQAVGTGVYDNEGQPVELRETFSGQPGRGTLHIIAAGVSKYPRMGPQDQLRVAASDAAAVVDNVATQGKSTFGKIEVHKMLDGAAGGASILRALGSLKESKAEDAVLLFLSGHGFGNEQDWFFMPSDASFEDPKSWLKATEIRAALEQAGAQRIFVVVDSCYSGVTVDKFNAVVSFQTRFLENGLRGAGVQVLTATRRDQLAPESVELGYGFLTYVLLQGLKGGADLFPKDGVVTSQEVARYAYDTLPQVFRSQRQKNPRAFQRAYGDDIQEPAIYSLGADLTLGMVGQ